MSPERQRERSAIQGSQPLARVYELRQPLVGIGPHVEEALVFACRVSRALHLFVQSAERVVGQCVPAIDFQKIAVHCHRLVKPPRHPVRRRPQLHVLDRRQSLADSLHGHLVQGLQCGGRIVCL